MVRSFNLLQPRKWSHLSLQALFQRLKLLSVSKNSQLNLLSLLRNWNLLEAWQKLQFSLQSHLRKSSLQLSKRLQFHLQLRIKLKRVSCPVLRVSLWMWKSPQLQSLPRRLHLL
jgi:hypothetical protein